MKKRIISESTLRADLNELAHAFIRELAVASKKVAIYGPHHPQSKRAVEKPFLVLARIFANKKYVNLNYQQGQLHLLNIALTESIFNGQVIQYLQYADLSAIIFENGLTVDELSKFIERFTTRVKVGLPRSRMDQFLADQRITRIQVNSELAFDVFSHHRQYRGDVLGDFSVRRLCQDQLPDDLVSLIEIADMNESELLSHYIDFQPEIVLYLLPEKIGSLPIEAVRQELKTHSENLTQAASDEDRSGQTERLVRMLTLLECHADHETLVGQFNSDLKRRYKAFEELGSPNSTTGRIRLELRQHSDQLLSDHFGAAEKSLNPVELSDNFMRLTKTGQHQHAREVYLFLMDRLSDSNSLHRQHALEVLIDIIKRLELPTQHSLIMLAFETVIECLNTHRETFEYSELIYHLFEKGRQVETYNLIAQLTSAMAVRRQTSQGVTVYDSVAIKKALTNINNRQVVDQLVAEMIDGEFDRSNLIRQILTDLGSEEVALALSEIISHPKRQVRQAALRILAELGKAALTVFSQMLMDDTWFEREPGRHELPDTQWYVLRNSIFVLGSLKDEAGLPPLRLRMSDQDVRIRREIVDSLEKITGDDAVDLLILMADDPVLEIREKAVRTAGLIGSPDCVPLLIDLAGRTPGLSAIVIWAVGKIGGDEALAFLSGLLADPDRLTDLAAPKVSRDELRVAVVKALGRLGDERALESIKGFQSSLSTTQKLFFKNSPLQKTISEIIDQK